MKKKKACLHMEVFENFGAPQPDEVKREQRSPLKKELVELLLKIVEKLSLLKK